MVLQTPFLRPRENKRLNCSVSAPAARFEKTKMFDQSAGSEDYQVQLECGWHRGADAKEPRKNRKTRNRRSVSKLQQDNPEAVGVCDMMRQSHDSFSSVVEEGNWYYGAHQESHATPKHSTKQGRKSSGIDGVSSKKSSRRQSDHLFFDLELDQQAISPISAISTDDDEEWFVEMYQQQISRDDTLSRLENSVSNIEGDETILGATSDHNSNDSSIARHQKKAESTSRSRQKKELIQRKSDTKARRSEYQETRSKEESAKSSQIGEAAAPRRTSLVRSNESSDDRAVLTRSNSVSAFLAADKDRREALSRTRDRYHAQFATRPRNKEESLLVSSGAVAPRHNSNGSLSKYSRSSQVKSPRPSNNYYANDDDDCEEPAKDKLRAHRSSSSKKTSRSSTVLQSGDDRRADFSRTRGCYSDAQVLTTRRTKKDSPQRATMRRVASAHVVGAGRRGGGPPQIIHFENEYLRSPQPKTANPTKTLATPRSSSDSALATHDRREVFPSTKARSHNIFTSSGVAHFTF